jgi:hypothetical protein
MVDIVLWLLECWRLKTSGEQLSKASLNPKGGEDLNVHGDCSQVAETRHAVQ